MLGKAPGGTCTRSRTTVTRAVCAPASAAARSGRSGRSGRAPSGRPRTSTRPSSRSSTGSPAGCGAPAGLPHGGAASALRRLLAGDPLAHAQRGHRPHPDDPDHREGPAGRGHADHRAAGVLAGRHIARATSRTTTPCSWPCPSIASERSTPHSTSARPVRSEAITRAVLIGRDPGFSLPLLPD